MAGFTGLAGAGFAGSGGGVGLGTAVKVFGGAGWEFVDWVVA